MEDKVIVVEDLMVTEKIPFTDRLLKAAACLFGQTFAGIAMICISPFMAIQVMFKSERRVPDLSKIPVGLISGPRPMGGNFPTMHPGMAGGPTSEQIEDVNKQMMDMFDTRESWKKDHDDEYGEDNEQS